VTTAAGAHDQQLVLYYPASVSRAFLVGLLAMPRFPSRECLHKSIVINLIRAIVVAFTLIVKSRPREAARGIACTRATEHNDGRVESAVVRDPTGEPGER
jgi:hypothetical protein